MLLVWVRSWLVHACEVSLCSQRNGSKASMKMSFLTQFFCSSPRLSCCCLYLLTFFAIMTHLTSRGMILLRLFGVCAADVVSCQWCGADLVPLQWVISGYIRRWRMCLWWGWLGLDSQWSRRLSCLLKSLNFLSFCSCWSEGDNSCAQGCSEVVRLSVIVLVLVPTFVHHNTLWLGRQEFPAVWLNPEIRASPSFCCFSKIHVLPVLHTPPMMSVCVPASKCCVSKLRSVSWLCFPISVGCWSLSSDEKWGLLSWLNSALRVSIPALQRKDTSNLHLNSLPVIRKLFTTGFFFWSLHSASGASDRAAPSEETCSKGLASLVIITSLNVFSVFGQKQC